MMDIYEIRLAA